MDLEDYDVEDVISREQLPTELPKGKVVVHSSLGFPCLRKLSFQFLEPKVLVYASGNIVHILDLKTKQQTLLYGPRCGGITAISTREGLLAMAEKHHMGPNIYLYNSSLELKSILRKGASKEYSIVAFGPQDLLLSVSSAPDYQLCVFQCSSSQLLLRASAFATDVYAASFSLNQLVSCGPAHIKFWKISNTFTGLKLQGNLGRFGAHELCDVHSFVFISTGKPGIRVLSSTDLPQMLLWDDNLILSLVNVPSPVSSCFLRTQLYTASQDGYIRVLDPTPLTLLEVNSTLELECLHSIQTFGFPILSLQPTEDVDGTVCSVDSNGNMFLLNPILNSLEHVFNFHAGCIASCSSCFRSHVFCTVGMEDKKLKFYDSFKATMLLEYNLTANASIVCYLPKFIDPNGSSLVIAFQDGSIRFFQHSCCDPFLSFEVVLTHAFRPFYEPIVSLCFSQSRILLTATKNSVFLFRFVDEANGDYAFGSKSTVEPLGVIMNLDIVSITTIDSNSFMISNNEKFLQILKIAKFKNYEAESNYVIQDYTLTPWTLINYKNDIVIKMPLFINNYFLAVCSGSEGDEVRFCSLTDPKISNLVLRTRTKITCINNNSGLLLGLENGIVYYLPVIPKVDDVVLWPNHIMDVDDCRYAKIALHLDSVVSISFSFDAAFFISTGVDGALIVSRNHTRVLSQPEYGQKIVLEQGLDLQNNYSVQDSKLRTQMDIQNMISQQKKQKRLACFDELRKEFNEIYQQNFHELFHIDSNLKETYNEKTTKKIARVKLETQWEHEKIAVLLRKLKQRYYDDILSHVIGVKKINNDEMLYSFRTQKIKAVYQEPKVVVKQKEVEKPKPQKLDEKREREQRQEAFKRLMAEKPALNADDPQSLEEIELAEKNKGDYKLKMDKNYIVPENELVNAEVKMNQMMLLQESLVNIMEKFNKKVELLQKERQKTLQKIEKRQQKFEIRSIEGTVFQMEEQAKLTTKIKFQIQVQQQKNIQDCNRFDKKHTELKQEYNNIAIDLKNAEIRLLLLRQEWKLLKEFEKHDNTLFQKFTQKQQEKKEIDVKLNEMISRMDEKIHEVENAVKKKKLLEKQVMETICENKFEESLLKIYRKKVKRQKQRQDSDSEESEIEDLDSEEEISDFIPGCDVLPKVISLREERLCVEENLCELQKSVDALKKEFDYFSKRDKQATLGLKQTEQEIQEFQSQKQQKLNEIYTVVPLCNLQIQNNDLTNGLVFCMDTLKKLQGRIQEIKEETEMVRKRHKELKTEHVNLVTQRKEKRQQLKDAERKCLEVQMLKFGRVVEVEKLERIGTSKNEDLTKNLQEKEQAWQKNLNKLDISKMQKKQLLDQTIIQNTQLLNLKFDLKTKKQRLEQSLDFNQQSVIVDISAGKAMEEAKQQCKLLTLRGKEQEEEIQNLKKELGLFKNY